jgi:hypothetical protein
MLISENKSIKDTTNIQLMEVDQSSVQKQSKMLNYEELMTKQSHEIIYILIQKINDQQVEISGLWNKLRKSQKKNK